MIDMLYSFWCGLSVAFSIIGLARLGAICVNDTAWYIAFAILIVLLVLSCLFFGWMMSEKHTQHKKEEVAK